MLIIIEFHIIAMIFDQSVIWTFTQNERHTADNTITMCDSPYS